MIVRRIVIVCALWVAATVPSAALPLCAQIIVGRTSDPYSAQFGEPVEVPLSDVARGLAYNKKAVITQGVLDMMDNSLQYYRLRDEGAVVLVLSVFGAYDEVRRQVGREVEVTGLVHEVPYRQESSEPYAGRTAIRGQDWMQSRNMRRGKRCESGSAWRYSWRLAG